MTPQQREAALRLAKALQNLGNEEEEAAALLRELAAEPEPNPFVGTMAEQLLQVIAGIWTEHPDYSLRQTLEALNALMLPAEPVQEPVAWIQPDHLQKARVAPFLCRVEPTKRMSDFVPLYAAPQQRKPLTHMEAVLIWGHRSDGPSTAEIVSFARAVEQAHGIGEKP